MRCGWPLDLNMKLTFVVQLGGILLFLCQLAKPHSIKLSFVGFYTIGPCVARDG